MNGRLRGNMKLYLLLMMRGCSMYFCATHIWDVPSAAEASASAFSYISTDDHTQGGDKVL